MLYDDLVKLCELYFYYKKDADDEKRLAAEIRTALEKLSGRE